jgi:UDP-glucose 4-epimerase
MTAFEADEANEVALYERVIDRCKLVYRALVAAGHRVIAPLRGRVDGYEGVRGERARRLAGLVTVIDGCPFGSEALLSLVRGDAWDLFAHHGAATANYRSADFDVVGALAENTSGLPALLRSFQEAGGRGVLLTGSVFEQDEGVGNAPMAAFSPYGLSKGLTAQAFRYWCGTLDVPLKSSKAAVC